jgi:hypothetical protein
MRRLKEKRPDWRMKESGVKMIARGRRDKEGKQKKKI